MWLPRLMRAADEQEQAMSWARVGQFVRTDPAPHHRQLGPCHCNLPRRPIPPLRRPPGGLFGTDYERSSAILEEVRNGWRLAFFKWLAIVLLVVLLIFIGLTSSVYSNDRPHATTLLMVMIMGAAVLLGGLLCCVRARAYYDHSLEAAVTRARLATEPQSQTLILVASHSSDQPHRHTVFDGRNCAFPSNACPPIFQFRGPIGLPTYEEAIVATTAQEWKGGDLAPPSYSESLPEPSQLDASATTTEAATTASVTVDVDSPVSPSTPEDELPHPTPLVCNDNSSNP